MTLTVRLDPALESALDRYCAERGVTKSLVVQESLAEYLVTGRSRRQPDKSGSVAGGSAVSENYKAFAKAGLIGAGELGGARADKAGVRERVMQQVRRRSL